MTQYQVSWMFASQEVTHCTYMDSVNLLKSWLFFTGDHFYKRNKALPPEEQMISAMPDVKVLTLNEDHDFMVIACDGIW